MYNMCLNIEHKHANETYRFSIRQCFFFTRTNFSLSTTSARGIIKTYTKRRNLDIKVRSMTKSMLSDKVSN